MVIESREVAFAPELNQLPTPREFGQIVQARVDAEIIRMREERGEVAAAADVYPLVRGLYSASEQLGEYATALNKVTTSIKQELEEELMAIPGNEQDGIPVSGAVVPDLDGTDIKLALDSKTERNFDLDSLIAVSVAEKVSADLVQQLSDIVVSSYEQDDWVDNEFKLTQILAEAVESTVRRVLALGNFTPQVTKVRAYAKEAAGAGDDSSASVIQGAMRERKVYTGIKVSREERK